MKESGLIVTSVSTILELLVSGRVVSSIYVSYISTDHNDMVWQVIAHTCTPSGSVIVAIFIYQTVRYHMMQYLFQIDDINICETSVAFNYSVTMTSLHMTWLLFIVLPSTRTSSYDYTIPIKALENCNMIVLSVLS